MMQILFIHIHVYISDKNYIKKNTIDYVMPYKKFQIISIL